MQLARFLTGIEIHPAAKIGKRLFMDPVLVLLLVKQLKLEMTLQFTKVLYLVGLCHL